jgi:multidrug transporter EmrE-like cation transporter
LAVVSVLLVSWSALSLLVEGRDVPLGRSVSTVEGQLEVPAQRSGRSQGGEDAWTALIVAVVIPLVAVMLLGFEPDVSELWLRPLVIVVVAVAVLGLSVACFSMPSSAVRVGFAAVSIVLLCWPASIGVLLLATSRSTELSRVLVGVIVAAVGLGAGLGPQWPARGIVGGLLLLSVGAAGAWAVPESRLLLAVPVAAMAGGASAALLGGLRFGLESPLGVRLVGAGAFSALTLGVVLALPLSWALGGGLPVTTVAADADAKVLLGLTFAAAVLGAGYVATQSGRRPGAYN